MQPLQEQCARDTLAGAEDGSLNFPAIVARLMAAGFESYAVDYRRSVAIYYLPDGGSIVVPMAYGGPAVAPLFDTAAVQAAIRDAQQEAPGYSYAGFCIRVMAAGCTGYFVSFTGRRVVYMGRTGDLHVEHFPA
ncbi:hypothetical protein LWE61_16880 [Sphingobium sufflavum]|uniref:DUF1398 domain-containing protein n=1 Tax=Sphingobium sufflavum TaxID=1129547 RepID=UPI001F2BFB6A|nr:hypothetical protein [Sphingobium sufflavum]MCE7798214.1 hypothetical protein [Sphingobium sufflavum]